MQSEMVFKNARIVTATQCVAGALTVRDGCIGEIVEGAVHSAAVDCEGDYLIPGLVEIHTDNLENHMMPRPGVHWPANAAFLAHDAQVASVGITTVLNAISLGIGDETEVREAESLNRMIDIIGHYSAKDTSRADHLLHLRVELPGHDTIELFERYVGNPKLRLVSLMDHTPGQRQWRDLSKYRSFHSKTKRWTDDELKHLVEERRRQQAKYYASNRKTILAHLTGRNVAMASHDDTTQEHAVEGFSDGVRISEFPTTFEAAQKARELGMDIVAGAPNIVRGNSHSGNVSAQELAQRGLLDGLSSDYVPASLLYAAFLLHERSHLSLPDAIATVSSRPAQMAGLTDRGAITPGQRADLVQVSLVESVPVVKAVWRGGQRVA